MKKIVSSILLMGSLAVATPIIMESGYVKAGVSEDGTFGVGGSTSPGILYDENGTGNYGVDDYLTPGTPFEFFSLKVDGVLYTNGNSKSLPDMNTSISGDAHNVTVVSYTPDNALKITQTYTLEEGSKLIVIDAEIENISASDFSSILFSRGLDPDVDVVTFGSYDTNNTRGLDRSAIDLPNIPANSIILAEGVHTKKVISLFYRGTLEHNTTTMSPWPTDPTIILQGSGDTFGDHSINVAMNIGSIAAGDIVSFRYAYGLGNDIGDLGEIIAPEPPVVLPPVGEEPPVKPEQPIENAPYDRNDNPITPQNGNAPAYSFGTLFMMMLMFGFFAYRRTTAKEARS